MRKYVCSQLIEILSTIWEGVKQSKTLKPQMAESVLTDCYLAVRTVEQTLQTGISEPAFMKYQNILAETKALLEEINIRIHENIQVSDIARKLKNNLKQIRRQLSEETEIQLEIVFMPYKASMWDALESVWKAAAQDAQCKSYVVPIPYYERKAGFQLGEFHYEGGQFPPDVPITYYEEYDLSVQKPDIVYIHNPYDECNYVTSVDPRYYTPQLKKYTDMLIYIPYFVSGNTVSESFCRMPGVYNADKVVVQSQDIQQQYSWYSGLPLTHFLPLGSPKFDKAANEKKDGCELPESWKRLIGNKKVVLFNSGLTNIIGNTDLILQKLQYIFSCFTDRNDVVLWWRPHPLSRSTASSMRPEFYEQYCAIEDWYKEAGIGIFDDTSDLHRAIAYADAYYGDSSSLIPLCEAAGMPVMMANVGIHQSRDIFSYYFDDCVIRDGFLYFSENNFNGLFCIELDTGKVTFLGRFPDEDENTEELYKGMVEKDGKIFFAPSLAREIAVYEIEKRKFSKIPLQFANTLLEDAAKFFACVSYKDYVFIVGCAAPEIVRIDTRTLETTQYTDWYTKNQDIFRDTPDDVLFKHGAVVVGNCLYIASCRCNVVLEFNIDTGKGRFLTVGCKEKRYGSICYDGENFWLSPRYSGALVCWNREKNTTLDYDNITSNGNTDFITVSSFVADGKLSLYTYASPGRITLDLKTKESTVEPAAGGYWFAKRHGDSVYALAVGETKNEFWICEKGNAWRSIPLLIPEEWRTEIQNVKKISMYKKMKQHMGESVWSRLEDYLDALVTEQNQKRPTLKNENYDGKCGKRIHEYILELGKKQ